VTVQVERLLSQRVSVTGAVMRPGLLAARHNR